MINGFRKFSLFIIMTAAIFLFNPFFLTVNYAKDTESVSILIEDNLGQLLLEEKIKNDEQIVLYYNHSVMKVPVLQFYKVRNGSLYLVCLISREPLLSFPGYEHYSFEPWDGSLDEPLMLDLDFTSNDWFIIRDLKIKRIKDVPLLVGQDFVNHILFIGSKKINLANLVPRGKVVILKIR